MYLILWWGLIEQYYPIKLFCFSPIGKTCTMQSWREEHEILSFWKFFEIVGEAIPQVIIYWEYFANYGTYHSITSLFSNVHSMIMLFISLFKLARAWRHMCKEQLPNHVQVEKFPKNHLKKSSKNVSKISTFLSYLLTIEGRIRQMLLFFWM